jgi:hypothetical protein
MVNILPLFKKNYCTEYECESRAEPSEGSIWNAENLSAFISQKLSIKKRFRKDLKALFD